MTSEALVVVSLLDPTVSDIARSGRVDCVCGYEDDDLSRVATMKEAVLPCLKVVLSERPCFFCFLLKLITYMETPYGGLWYAAGNQVRDS